MARKVNYKNGLEVFLKNNFPSEKVDSSGLKLISELLNDANSLLISHIETQYSAISKVNVQTFQQFARIAIEENFPGDLKAPALSEALKQLALLECGCLVYGKDITQVRGRLQAKRKDTREETELKRMEASIILCKKGILKLFSTMYPNFKVDAEALGSLVHCIHGFSKMMVERASEKAVNKGQLQTTDLMEVLPEYLEGQGLRVALSEANRCLALYENGLLEFKPKKTYESIWSEENIVSEKILSTVFRSGIQNLANEIAPGCTTDVQAQKYLGHILMDLARYIAENTSETCRKENILEMKDGDIYRLVGETFPRELKQHAQMEGNKDVMEFWKSEMISYEKELETETIDVKSKKEAQKLVIAKSRKKSTGKKSSPKRRKKSPPAKSRKKSTGKKSSPKRHTNSPTTRRRKSSSSPKRSRTSKRKRSRTSSKDTKLSKEVAEKMKFSKEYMSRCSAEGFRQTVPLDREADSFLSQGLKEICNEIIDKSVTRAAGSDEFGIENIEEILKQLFPGELAIHALVTAYNAVSLFFQDEERE